MKFLGYKPNKHGKAAWKDASVNPISSYAQAQKLLDTTYFKSDKQGFNVNRVIGFTGKQEAQIIRFHSERQNIWHAYELTEDLNRTIGSKIIKKFREDRLITPREYDKLVTNKWKK